MSQHNIFTVISSILTVGILAGGAVFIVMLYLQNAEATTRYNEIDDCLKASSLVTTYSDNQRTAVTTEPIRDLYQACLADKNITITK